MGLFDIFFIGKIKQENADLKQENERLQGLMQTLGINDYQDAMARISAAEKEHEVKLAELNEQIASGNSMIAKLQNSIAELQERNAKLDKAAATQERKISKCKELYKSIDYAINNFFESDVPFSNCKLASHEESDLDFVSPSVILKLHCMDMKSLRSAYKDNKKQINKVLEQYSARYTTKANKAIYSLMVIALRAELQNILYNLKYEKLEKSIDDVKAVTAKYLAIAGEGNQSIAGTLTKFIGEIEYLFINAVKIEYNYYVKKEQARQEQLALKEQMRQETEERRALEAERKKVEKEEAKFKEQIENLNAQASSAEGSELEALQKRILELQAQLSNVVVKKEEIANLQNGKAGNVYILSNLGSFGDNVFKIGMTRRSDPQDRVNELSDASVPFKFDVHSFIFSDDAVALETALHKRMHEKRVNKVNLRKEFFYSSVDELEALVYEICPTAEFNRTMLAEEFLQSQATDTVYSSDVTYSEDE